ncbi:Cytochrome c mitochondrial import factor CYC2 [Colletotrichum chlorophyti]|uniref:Cytochrome c mitochondrial import factor CYC2 n=1 Tax=Colletotrichum chlorophyti TaxID=708187 RepID=A0A1Q8RL37_9PEZI|nr:Cytochrome c mitochondrial import factor CYC2 [Colletotrichum chlorophyti]
MWSALSRSTAAGAALRPSARRSLIHTRRHLRAALTPGAALIRGTPEMTTICRQFPRHFSNSGQERPERTVSTHQPPSTNLKPTPAHKKASFISPRYLPVLLLLAIGGVAWDSQWLFPSETLPTDPSTQTALGSARKFVPFTVMARDPVSPTSFILTLKPPSPSSSSTLPISSLWQIFDLWCVEVKQPQIQVAREYTPLPSPDPDTVRLYVRALQGGEVSTYLSRLAPGNTLELRGPHGEFDLRSRLSSRGDRVVFLAGGTGIASALQAAHAVLALPEAPSMTILWAVRGRDEVQHGNHVPAPKPRSSWNPFSRSGPSPHPEVLSADLAAPSPITRELLALKREHGDRLDVRVAVDQEGTSVHAADLAAALAQPGPRTQTLGPTHAVEGCGFHSQAAHVGMVDGAPNAGKRGLFKESDCACSHETAPGKNVLVVSGPEGFVQAYAGAKIWRDGGQLQGPVGGMLGALRKRDPDVLKDWIVLKL